MTTPLELSRVPDAAAKRNISESQWNTLKHSLFPGAKDQSVLLVIDYCRARGLDPMKKPCHIVPMEVRTGNTTEWRDVVMAGIYEHRTTAQRTGEYRGFEHPPTYGPDEKQAGVMAPEWCDLTLLRGVRGEPRETFNRFPVRTYFREVVKKKNGQALAKWAESPRQMLTKCAEAAALRMAFPDALGGEPTVEEMEGTTLAPDHPVLQARPLPDPPPDFDVFKQNLAQGAEAGEKAFAAAWKHATTEQRAYLVVADPEIYAQLKAHATRPRDDAAPPEPEA